MAIRYLCPICDHELVAGSFCSSCKKFIKEPVEYKGAYLPNEDRGNYTLNRNMSESERRSAINQRHQPVQSRTSTVNSSGRTYASQSGRTGTVNSSGRTYTSQSSSRTNAGTSTSRTYTAGGIANTATSSGRVNTDYGNCGGHKASDYGVPNVDPHAPKKKKKSGFKYIALIYVIIIILKMIFDSLG